MPLYVRDEAVTAMVVELQVLLNAPSKTEALRQALCHEIERQKAKIPLGERIARLQERAAGLGPGDPGFDMKHYTDEMWDNM